MTKYLAIYGEGVGEVLYGTRDEILQWLDDLGVSALAVLGCEWYLLGEKVEFKDIIKGESRSSEEDELNKLLKQLEPDWGDVDDGHSWVAVDVDGGVWSYADKPKHLENSWDSHPADFIDKLEDPRIGEHWKKLIWKRPNNED